MLDFSRPLGDAVKQAREKSGLTQVELANALEIDSRTILNIENYKGNPKMKILFPLIRLLRIDSREIFHPEEKLDSPEFRHLRMLIDSCTEEEAAALYPVVQAVVAMLHSNKVNDI